MTTAATYGGEGWRSRGESLADEVRAGHVWEPCGVCSEVEPLRRVLLSWPPDSMGKIESPDEWLFLDRVDLKTIRAQTEAIAAFYESVGVRVHLFRPASEAPPNFVFMRDTFFMTAQGAVVARPAGKARAGEERFALEALASAGVPVLAMPSGNGVFEGADALWLDERTVLVSTGFRTNEVAFGQLCRLLYEMGVTAVPVHLPEAVQHLLGAVNLVDRKLAVCREELLTPDLARTLGEAEIRLLPVAETPEVKRGYAMNFVTLAPMKIVMPAGCPETRRLYESHGIECSELPVGEYLKAAGGLGCLTGVLQRG